MIGQTISHYRVIEKLGGYQLLITGDCVYTLRHLATKQVQAVRMSKRMGDDQIDSIERIGGLRRLLPGLHLVPGHDHTDYQWKLLVPYLSKGWLTENERRALAGYESSLFGSEWTLRPEALPQFQPAKDGTSVGAVSEPEISGRSPATKTASAGNS